MKRKPDKNPPNLYPRGEAWILDFYYRGMRVWENLGCISRSLAKERAGAKRTAVAEGRELVEGKRWNGSEWITETPMVPAEDPMFPDAMTRFLEFYKAENADYTYRKYALPASKRLKTFFDSYRLSQISLVLIEKYKRDRKNAGKADATINRDLTLLRHMFNKCIDFKLATANPFRVVTKLPDGTYRVQRVKLYKEQGRERYLTQEEGQRLLDQCHRDLKTVVLMAMHTGFRSSELKTLRWKHVDLVNGSATVLNCYAKNGDTRTVPLSDDLAAALRALKEQRKAKAEDLLFTKDGKTWESWREGFDGAVKRAGLEDFHFHDLRHCFGSHLGMNNVNQKAMMELMGHKDPKMTLRYTHLSVEYKRQAVQRLPRFTVTEGESQQISQHPEDKKVVSFSK